MNFNHIFNFKFFKHLFVGIFIINILLNGILFGSFYKIAEIFTTNHLTIINNIIKHEGSISIENMCYITNCLSITIDNKRVNSDVLINTSDLSYTDFQVNYTEYYKFKIPSLGIEIMSDISDIWSFFIHRLIYISIIVNIFFVIGFIIFHYSRFKNSLLNVLNTSEVIRDKNMKILTENIHHELNTPVAIIHGNVKHLEEEYYKLYDLLEQLENEYTLNIDLEHLKSIPVEFNHIFANIDQITTVLKRMSNFKELKYSNGNKTLQDIFEYGSNAMLVYKKSNFKVQLDPDLVKYGLAGPLTNGDLLNIINNHFRNSIEAKANLIIIQTKFIPETKKTGMLKIFIIDNGSGLRDRNTGLLLSKSKYQDIFLPYYSSKNENGESKINNYTGFKKFMVQLINILKIIDFFEYEYQGKEIRGVGLYLNQQLLKSNGGDLKLRETSEKGTVFEIQVPVVLK